MNATELKELLANATPGTWYFDGMAIKSAEEDVYYNHHLTDRLVTLPTNIPDARLIALAPQLAAEVIKLEAEVERFRIRARELVAYSEGLEREAEMNAEDSERLDAKNAKLRQALTNIRELNMLSADENGHRWANSELIEQEIVFALNET